MAIAEVEPKGKPAGGSQQVRIGPPPIQVQPAPPSPTPPPRSEWRRVLDAAEDKIKMGDGAGCLAVMATLPPVPQRSEDDAVSTLAICTMIAGDCLGGREVMIKHGASHGWSRDRAERAADGFDLMYCAIDAAPNTRWGIRAMTRIQIAVSQKRSCKPIFAKVAERRIVLPGAPHELALLETACLVLDGDCAKARAKHATAIAVPPGLPPDRLAELEANREKAFVAGYPRCAK